MKHHKAENADFTTNAAPQSPDRQQCDLTTGTDEDDSTKATYRLSLNILGPPRLTFRLGTTQGEREITGKIGPRLRELVVLIGIRPDGVHRDEVIHAFWPNTNPQRRSHPLNTALGRLRRVLGESTQGAVANLIVYTDQRLRLDPAIATVDLWRFRENANYARSAPDPDSRIRAYRRMISLYKGLLAEGLETSWIVEPRKLVNGAATSAIRDLAALLADTDAQQSLDLLGTALGLDPYNEIIYQDIMRLQAELGPPHSIRRTLQLLKVRLTEINEVPSAETDFLVSDLQHQPLMNED